MTMPRWRWTWSSARPSWVEVEFENDRTRTTRETAGIVTTWTASAPERREWQRHSDRRAVGSVTMQQTPGQRHCPLRATRCSGSTSGISSGRSGPEGGGDRCSRQGSPGTPASTPLSWRPPVQPRQPEVGSGHPGEIPDSPGGGGKPLSVGPIASPQRPPAGAIPPRPRRARRAGAHPPSAPALASPKRRRPGPRLRMCALAGPRVAPTKALSIRPSRSRRGSRRRCAAAEKSAKVRLWLTPAREPGDRCRSWAPGSAALHLGCAAVGR